VEVDEVALVPIGWVGPVRKLKRLPLAILPVGVPTCRSQIACSWRGRRREEGEGGWKSEEGGGGGKSEEGGGRRDGGKEKYHLADRIWLKRLNMASRTTGDGSPLYTRCHATRLLARLDRFRLIGTS
jgi:hypothetical protein